MNLTELKEKPIQELVQIAEGMGAENVSRLKKQDVIFTILKNHSSSGEDISGGGVLEILQDGPGGDPTGDPIFFCDQEDVPTALYLIRI